MTSARDPGRTPAMRIALAAVAASMLLLVWEIVQAVRPPALPNVAPTLVASVGAVRRPAARPPVDIDAAVENDLFASDRSAPDVPYRMPGENRPDDKPAAAPTKPFVLGTAVGSDGRNFATLQLGNAPPQLVVVGDKIGEWVVRGISRGKVVLVSNDGVRAELTVVKPGT